MIMRRALFAALLSILASHLVVEPVRAQSRGTAALIERGIALHDDLNFEEALQVLSAALVRADNTSANTTQIYRYLAYTYMSLGRDAEARGAYRLLLALDAQHEVDSSLSPRFRQFFDQVREGWIADGRPGAPPPAPVEIRHTSPPQSEPGEGVELRAQVEDPAGRVARLVVAYRQGTEAVFRRLDTRPVGADLVADIPGEDVAPPLVEYYFEAVDAAGLPVASRGDVQAPLRIAVPDPEGGGSIFRTWWFWTGVAVLTAGAIVGGVLAFGGDEGQGSPTGTLRITVR